jgi:hypothetical protein
MKLRAEFAELLFEELLPEAGARERDALVDRLEELVTAGILTRAQLLELEGMAGLLAATMAEQAFVVGLECGRDLRRLVCA